MTSVFRILFDISVYYGVTGIYLQAFADKMPFIPGFIFLFAAVLLYGVFESRDKLQKYKAYLFALPLLGALFRPALIDLVQIIPVWLYAGIVLTKNLAGTDMKAFTARFVKAFLLIVGLSLPLVLLALPIFAFFVNVLGYVIMMLVTGVICFRSLHDHGGGIHHLVVISLFAAVCGVLCYFQIPQTLLTLFRDHVILEIVAAVGSLFGFVTITGSNEQQKNKGGYQTDLKASTDTEPLLNKAGPFSLSDTAVYWMKTIFYVILGIVILVIVILLVIRLIEGLRKMDQPEKQRAWKDVVSRARKTDSNEPRKRRRKFGAHRLTVRYYYWRYMRECEKRGITVEKGWTVEDLSKVSNGQFLFEDITAMQQLYIPVRYNDRMEVTSLHAKQAAKLWNNLKKNKPK